MSLKMNQLTDLCTKLRAGVVQRDLEIQSASTTTSMPRKSDILIRLSSTGKEALVAEKNRLIKHQCGSISKLEAKIEEDALWMQGTVGPHLEAPL